MKYDNTPLTTGQERLRSDRRQLGGMLLVVGICVTFQPLTGMGSFIGFDLALGGAAFSTIWQICCGIMQMVFGTFAMIVGYLSLVHDYGNRRLTGTLLVMTQLSWIPFVTGIIQVARATSGPYIMDSNMSTSSEGGAFLEEYIVNPFVPKEYLPNKYDVQFLGSMGILGLISYGIGFFGSLAFLEFALYTFDVGKPTHRDARYYRGRLLFYCFVMLIAGMSQILFGAYVLFEFGGGQLSPPIEVVMYRVSFPAITVAVGSIQMVVGYYGVGNYLRLFPIGPNDNNFQIIALSGWLSQLILQYIVQLGFVGRNEDAAALVSLAFYSFGMNILPAFLDYKMRTTPIPLRDEYYEAVNTEEEIDFGIRSVLASTGSIARPLRVEKDQILDNLKTLEIQDRSDYNSEVNERSSNGAEIEQRNENNDIFSQPRKGGLFARIFARKSDQGDMADQNQPLNDSKIELREKLNDHNESRSKVVRTIEHPDEPGITVEEIVEYPMDFGITVEQTVEYPDDRDAPMNNTAGPFLEPGITVEEFIEYPDMFKRTRQDNDNDDEDTPPRSNESFSTDMGDTWGEQAKQQMPLSTIGEEISGRIVFGEQKNRRTNQGQPLSLGRERIHSPRDSDTERAKISMYTSSSAPNSSIPDRYYDYDSDTGFEISEATPDDDTAALDEKIDKLKGELVSDTNLETYLNRIL